MTLEYISEHILSRNTIWSFFDIYHNWNYPQQGNKGYIKSEDTLNVSEGTEVYMLKKLKKPNRHQLTILTAVMLLIVGFSIWLYTSSVIQRQTQLLNSSNLTQEEMWSYEGSLQWWKTTNTTTITPLATIMITVGFISLVGPIVWTRMPQRQALLALTDNLELASAEEFEIEPVD